MLTGGLLLTKKVETKATRTTTSQESFLLLHRKDGGRDIMIHGRRIDYRFLGADLQPASAANFDRMTAKLRALAPRVPYDDRVSRPGLVSGLSSAAANPVDLALWLVLLTHLRGVANLTNLWPRKRPDDTTSDSGRLTTSLLPRQISPQ